MEWRKNTLRGLALVLALALVLGLFVGVVLLPSQAKPVGTARFGTLADFFESYHDDGHSFTLTSGSSRLYLTRDLNDPANQDLLQVVQLVQQQFAADGFDMAIVWYENLDLIQAGDIYLDLRSCAATTDEGYEIYVSQDGNGYASVFAFGLRGLLYGANTLQKHIRYSASNVIYGFHTYDTPDTKERTAQLDCARKYLSPDYIKNFVKQLSWMGYNTLQLHISEDGGFRADFWDTGYLSSRSDGKYGTGEGQYSPQNDLSWLCGSKTQYWTHDSSLTGVNYRNDPDKDRHLSTADLLDIIDTCKQYQIDIIPSFDSPAHMDYLTWKFEQNYKNDPNYSFQYNSKTYWASSTGGCINYYGYTGATDKDWYSGTGSTGQYYSSMDINSDMAKAFVYSIYDDIAEFFKVYAGSTKFNIGADECRLNSSTSYDTFVSYINSLNALLKGKGYTVRMFNDFIRSGYLDQFDRDIQILYWDSPRNTITGGSKNRLPVSDFVNNGRILYNCINTSTYYVLRINDAHGDARSVSCKAWEFYHADEANIWNEWYPADISAHGLYSENVTDVPADQLGGGYFLTWHDYAAVNTEVEIWNGVYDAANSADEYYSLRDRMWSNIIKQWNWDVNTGDSKVPFSLDAWGIQYMLQWIGDFPCEQQSTRNLDGRTCYCIVTYSGNRATPTTLPDKRSAIHIGDKSVLAELLNDKYPARMYSPESYAVYENAYIRGQNVYNNSSANQKEVTSAITAIQTAIAGLEEVTFTVTVYSIVSVNGTDTVLKKLTASFSPIQPNFEIDLPALDGYELSKVEGATFSPSASGDGSGYLTGPLNGDHTINVWYRNKVNTGELDALIFNAVTAPDLTGSISYTSASWSAYNKALNDAKKFVLSANTTQSEVDALADALADAQTALTAPSDSTWLQISQMDKTFPLDRQIGLYIKTSCDVGSLTVTLDGTEVDVDFLSSQVQLMNDGEIVKYWIVFLPPHASGNFTYTVTGTSYDGTTSSNTVNVTVS